MPQGVTAFDTKKVSVIVNGKYLVGYMDGTYVQCSKDEDNKIKHVGAQGEVTFTQNADNTGTITVTLKQTSSSLPYLISLASKADPFPIQVVDANGDSKIRVGGSKAVLLKTPDIERGAEITGVEVQFSVADYSVK